MKLLLSTLLLASPLFAQVRPDASLAPFRSAAHAAFTAEMAHADQPFCPNLITLVEVAGCLNAALEQSQSHLVTYRAALRSSIAARKSLFGVKALQHLRASERLWDLFVTSQVKASGDIVEGPELAGGAEVETRIDLIRAHLRMLDRIYYTLLHDDCGACLVDH